MSAISASVSRLGRPSDRQDLIVQEIREEIVGGRLSPGSRLPTREEIGLKYGAGANTVQRALDRLRHDGFVLSNGRNGTHVSLEPPHLTRYAIVFPSVPSQSDKWVRFWTALSNEATSAQRSQNRKLPLYYGVNHDPTQEDYQVLLRDVLSHRVAGIIFASSPHDLLGTPIVDEPAIPRVGIMMPSEYTSFPVIYPDVNSFFDKAIDFLQQQGCRKIAFIHPPGLEKQTEAQLQRIAAYGMQTQPYWSQTVSLAIPHSARNIAHLMMNAAQHDRPDGLIISDDNLVEYATAGLLAAGVKVADDIQVVAHCNFPWPTPSVVAVHRLGFDAREVLQAAIAAIDSMRQGKSVAPVQRIAACFESELLSDTNNSKRTL